MNYVVPRAQARRFNDRESPEIQTLYAFLSKRGPSVTF
ncbi:unknown protein [Cronobacter turicensis z3032]|uniref:Uncharacterized protein n=1 Tax=Cronobacter turicensis (strain DSM 18703 / CCUG 55852 / LMG 23827 / z3032) TaxID=693216 RepID=C9XUZ4_CROTZ|nr:unknown protein [Cronobacter turicensis z3032]